MEMGRSDSRQSDAASKLLIALEKHAGRPLISNQHAPVAERGALPPDAQTMNPPWACLVPNGAPLHVWLRAARMWLRAARRRHRRAAQRAAKLAGAGSPCGTPRRDLVRTIGQEIGRGGHPGFCVPAARVPPGYVVSADFGSFAPNRTTVSTGQGGRR
jgi:hypothetical protein